MSDQYAIYPSLKGQTVLLTGGATGIGAEIVRAFAAQGCKVGFLDFDRDNSQALVDEFGPDVDFEYCDLRDIDALKKGVAALASRQGGATVLVNNAARDDRHDWQEIDAEYWDERQNTNLRHMFFAIQAAAPAMIEAGGGSIINMGSNSWWEKNGDMPAYTTAKSAVHGLTRGMARTLGGDRIRVNCVVPGWVMTERQKDLWVTDENIEAHRQKQCLPDLVLPVHLARMVLFLASDDAAMCTASNFFVEAGSVG